MKPNSHETALRDALTALRRNIDVSTINNSKRSTARWEELIDQADAALALSSTPSNGGNADLRDALKAALPIVHAAKESGVLYQMQVALAGTPSNGNESGLREALDNLVGPGAQHEHTCDKAEHDEDGACIYCQARGILSKYQA